MQSRPHLAFVNTLQSLASSLPRPHKAMPFYEPFSKANDLTLAKPWRTSSLLQHSHTHTLLYIYYTTTTERHTEAFAFAKVKAKAST